MSIWDTILGREPQQLKLMDSPSTVKHIVPKVPVLDTTNQSLTRYATKSELVYACIDKKAQVACDPELIVQRKKGDDWEDDPEHPALIPFTNPNPWDDGNSLRRTWVASENISGEFYAEIVKSRAGVPVELYPLRTDCIFPQYRHTSSGDILEYYSYWIDGYEVKYKPEELLIYRKHGLGSMLSGCSPLSVALGAVDADLAATDYIRAFFNNGGTPSGILKITGRKMSSEELEAVQQKWVNRYGRGGKMRGGPAVLDEDADYQSTGSNLDELNSETLTQIDETRICMAFGVPPVLIGAYVGLKNVNQKASFKGAMEEFWENTMSPELRNIRLFLTQKWLPMFGEEEAVMKGDIRFYWNMDSVKALQDDIDAIHDRVSLGYKSGIYKLNEAREACGLEPVEDELGDQFFSQPADPNTEEIDDEETLVEKRERRILDAKLLTEKKTFELDGMVLSREPSIIEKSIDLKAIFDSYENGKEGLTKVVMQMRSELIIAASKEATEFTDKTIFELTLAPPKNAYKLVEKEIAKAVNDGRMQINRDAIHDGISKAELTRINQKINGLDVHTKGIIDDLIRTLVEITISRVIGEVATAAQNIFTALRVLGLDSDEIEQRMREDLEERSDAPYTRIAVQTVNRAVNEGRREEMRAREDEIDHYLYSAILDTNTCSPCEDWDGATASSLDQLPDTPNPECEGMGNCRCFIISVFASEAQ